MSWKWEYASDVEAAARIRTPVPYSRDAVRRRAQSVSVSDSVRPAASRRYAVIGS